MTVAAEICARCDNISLEPRGFCPRCGARDVAAGAIPGDGTVWAVTELHRLANADEEVRRIAIIALAAGPRIMATLDNALAIGDTVEVAHAQLDDGEAVVAAAPVRGQRGR